MEKVLKSDLKSPKRFKSKFKGYIIFFRRFIERKYKVAFDEEEIGDLLIAVCRTNEFNVLKNNKFLDKENIINWIEKKFISNTIFINLDDEYIIQITNLLYGNYISNV